MTRSTKQLDTSLRASQDAKQEHSPISKHLIRNESRQRFTSTCRRLSSRPAPLVNQLPVTHSLLFLLRQQTCSMSIGAGIVLHQDGMSWMRAKQGNSTRKG